MNCRKRFPPIFPKTMFGTITTALPPSGEKQFRKLAKNWSGGYTYASLGSGEIKKMGGEREVPQLLPTFIE